MEKTTTPSKIKPPIPPQTFSMLQTQLLKIQPSIRSSQQNITQWFIQNALRYTNPHIPRLQLLNKVDQLLVSNVSNQKYMNTLFLEDISVINLIQQASNLADIAFVLYKHTIKKVKNKQYGESVISVVKTKVQSLLRANQNSLIPFYNLREIQMFLQHKDKIQQSIYIVQPYELQHMEKQAKFIFFYVFKPLFERKSLQNVYDCLYPMILWFVVIKDNEIQKQMILNEMAKKIQSFLWGKKTAQNINLFTTFNWIMNLLSVKYLQQDSFSFQTLAPLLIKIKNFPLSQLINNWMATQRNSKNLPKKIENIFRNSLNSGVPTLCFKFIQVISAQLKKQSNYETLFHIFDTFIRKEYLSIKLSNVWLKEYMSILMMYAIGFINRDRLDGETQLDRLALNLNQVVCNTHANYHQCYMEIINFFRIYQNRFHFLSNTCKNLVSTLQRIYNYQIPVTSIHQEVANRMFKGYNANYDEDQILSLQRSHRYAGLVNLGNTCYMNSFIQSLFMTKKFKTLVIKAQDQGMVPANHPAFQSLVNLFSLLNSKTNQNLTQIEPIQFKHQIPQPFKSSYQQHDSSQFGRMLLDYLTNELKDTGLAEKINRLFTHELCTKIICRGCNMQRQMKQKTFDFILNVEQNKNEAITVSELLRNYFRGYELDGSNMLMCNRCHAKRSAFVLRQPIQLAEHLIATISIFKYDNLKSSKIIKPLNFQFILNFKNILPKVVNQNEVYQLYAFVLHIGTGVEKGHYQCFARNLEQNPMMWYKFDDFYVTEQEINQIEDFHFGQNQTPYILFYSNTNKSRKIISDK